MLDRRDLLKVLAAAALGAMAPRTMRARAGTRPDTRPDSRRRGMRPRYFVFVFLDGGIDAVYTTDPKVADQVEPGIDVPFAPEGMRTFGRNLVGPHLALLGEHARELCIVNGVSTQALNHLTGSRQFLRLRRDADRRMPTIMNLLGQRRDSQPVGELYVAYRASDPFTPGFLGSYRAGQARATTPDFYEVLESTAPDDLRRLARAYRGHQQRLAPGQRPIPIEQDTTAAHLRDSASLFERVAEIAPLQLKLPPPIAGDGAEMVEDKLMLSKQFQRILWILENDLSACVTTTHWNWDSHYENHRWQTRMSQAFYPALSELVDGLKARKNRHGSLWDQTVVVIASEVGRFPKLNHFKGKDHFPEVPFMLLGGRLTPGTYGATGKRMEALPISSSTGAAKPGGERLTLDDIGATLLLLAGCEPLTYGYTGRPLEFLLG